MGAGRPTDYEPRFCELVVELGAKGKSKAQIARDLGVVRNTLDNWAVEHPEFLSAIERARELSLGWWEEQGHLGIWSKEFNSHAYRLQVLNRFPADWRDKREQENTNRTAADDPMLALMRDVLQGHTQTTQDVIDDSDAEP